MTYDTLITTSELLNYQNKESLLIVDCRFYLDNPERGHTEYQEAHIPDAVYAHLDNDLSGPVVKGVTGRHPLPDVSNLVDLFSSWGIRPDTQVVAYDQGPGMFAARLWWTLKWLGHEKVAVLDGGWAKWQAENNLENKVIPVKTKSQFGIAIVSPMLADVSDVVAALNDKSVQLIDARPADRFRGENESIDPIAGHIPGAVSMPFTINLSESGVFQSKEKLRALYQPVIGNLELKQCIAYCGSGVTAAHDVLALYYTGLGLPKLYVGSWSHWITDSSRPIETGYS